MSDDDLKAIALAIMAGAWIGRVSKEMVVSGDKMRLAAQVARLDHAEVGEVSAVMLEALAKHLKERRNGPTLALCP